MNEYTQLPALLPVLPELVLAVGAMALLMFGVYARQDKSVQLTSGLAIVLLILAGVIVLWLPADRTVTFGGSFIVDGFARIMKVLALIGSAAAIAMSPSYFAADKRERFEYPVLIL